MTKTTIWKRLFCFALLLFMLLCMSGCQEKNEFDDPLFSDNGIAFLESLYGVDRVEVMEKLGVTEGEDIYEKVYGLWWFREPLHTDKGDLIKGLFTDVTDTVCGVEYRWGYDNAKELAEVTEAYYREAMEKYGKPREWEGSIHYDIEQNPNLLTKEENFDKIRSGVEGSWNQNWYKVGEHTFFMIDVHTGTDSLTGETVYVYSMKYRVLPDDWELFAPKQETE